MARYVKYIGLAHRRGITAQDWKLAGFPEGESIWWDASNGFHVPVDNFSDDQLRKVIEPDPGFVIVGVPREPQEFRGQDMTPGEYDQAVNEPIDMMGAVSDTDRDAQTGSGALGAPGGTAPATRGTTGTGSGHDTPGTV